MDDAERRRYLERQINRITGWMAEAGIEGVVYVAYVTEAGPPAAKAAVIRQSIEALQSWLVELEGEGDDDGDE